MLGKYLRKANQVSSKKEIVQVTEELENLKI